MSSNPSSTLLQNLIKLSEPLKQSLSKTPYTPPESNPNISIKSQLQSLLPNPEPSTGTEIRDFTLCISALASALNSTSQHLSWVPDTLSLSSVSVFGDFAKTLYGDNDTMHKCLMKVVIELMPEIVPLVKSRIKESAIDGGDNEGGGVTAASAGVPVAYAVLAGYQFRWLVTQVDAPWIGKLCPLVIPCALTALDHWSPEVKGQGMISLIYLAKNVNPAEIGGYADVILDACCQNIACDDEIWNYVVEMSVLLVTLTQQSNPRSSWYEKLLNEMLNHLERQPRNKERRIAWLTHIEPLLNGLGLILVAHFRRFFPLFFKWIHADDDETVLLVLERLVTVLRLTWIRNSPYIERLVDELVTLYKDAALKVGRENIRSLILQILTLIRMSRGSQLDATWVKYKDDPNLTALQLFSDERDPPMVG